MKHLYRSRTNRIIAGICGGLGDYLRFDPTLIRLGLIFLTVFTAIIPLLLAYLIACLIIPFEPKDHKVKPYKKLYRSKKNRKIAGICGGLSKLLSLDATILRIIFVALMFITGFFPLLIAYFVGWFIIPEEKRNEPIVEIEIS